MYEEPFNHGVNERLDRPRYEQMPFEESYQILSDEYDGIKTNDYRIAAGFFNLEDSKFDVYPVEEKLVPQIVEIFRKEGEKAYRYLYNHNYRYLQSKGSYLNKSFLQNRYKNSKFYKDLSFDEYFQEEIQDFFDELNKYLKNTKWNDI
mgnify:CR=1 FL=1